MKNFVNDVLEKISEKVLPENVDENFLTDLTVKSILQELKSKVHLSPLTINNDHTLKLIYLDIIK
jgi:hypothetical protein